MEVTRHEPLENSSLVQSTVGLITAPGARQSSEPTAAAGQAKRQIANMTDAGNMNVHKRRMSTLSG